MREIKFRGKTLYGKWAYGNLTTRERDNGLITCGNAVLSGKVPTSKYEVINNE